MSTCLGSLRTNQQRIVVKAPLRKQKVRVMISVRTKALRVPSQETILMLVLLKSMPVIPITLPLRAPRTPITKHRSTQQVKEIQEARQHLQIRLIWVAPRSTLAILTKKGASMSQVPALQRIHLPAVTRICLPVRRLGMGLRELALLVQVPQR